MARWQLGHRFLARQRYRKAVERIEKAKSGDPDLLRFRAEAKEIIKTDMVLPDDVFVPSMVVGNRAP